jgi:hypothetical protein
MLLQIDVRHLTSKESLHPAWRNAPRVFEAMGIEWAAAI